MIRIHDLTLRFGGKTVLDGFDLHVAPGEKVILTGPSGCGKSTVLRCLLGLVLPERGEIQVDGQTLGAESVWRLRRLMAYVPQEVQLDSISDKNATAGDAIRRPMQYRANRRVALDQDRLGRLLTRFGLSESIVDQPLTSLSGGEKQRLALISAVMLERPILVLDEPTSALDPNSRERVDQFLAGQQDRTVLAVSHVGTDVLAYPDRIVQMG